MSLLLNILVSAAAVLVTGRVLRGVTIDGFGTAIVVAVVLGAVNGLLGPALMALAVPLNALTLGLFTFVIVAGLVMLTSAVVPGFRVATWWWGLGFAVVLAFVNSAFQSVARA